jgi:hypothetical protein
MPARASQTAKTIRQKLSAPPNDPGAATLSSSGRGGTTKAKQGIANWEQSGIKTGNF